jgi:hypothetical protein
LLRQFAKSRSGLTLAASTALARIIQQHGGTIAMESSVNIGPTIKVGMPLAVFAVAPPLPPEPRTAIPQTEGDASRALVIDDEQGILEMVSDALERVKCRATMILGSAGVKAALA